jgi:hypothetical protein
MEPDASGLRRHAMRFLFGLLMLAMPAVALAQGVPAQPKPPGPLGTWR